MAPGPRAMPHRRGFPLCLLYPPPLSQFSTNSLQPRPLEVARVERTPEPNILRSRPDDDPGAAQAIETLRRRARPAVEHCLHDGRQLRITGEEAPEAPQVVAKDPLAAVRLGF